MRQEHPCRRGSGDWMLRKPMANDRQKRTSGSAQSSVGHLSAPAMVGSRAEASDTMLAWERFLTGEPFAQPPARNFVVSSWLRSRDFGIDHDEYPALRRWARRFRALPGFKTMPGIPDYH